MRNRYSALILLFAALLMLGGCSSSGEEAATESADSTESAASTESDASEPAEPMDTRPVEEIVTDMSWTTGGTTEENMNAAHEAISEGMSAAAAVEAAAAHLDMPNQAGGGTVNWVLRNADNDCVNLMLTVEDGAVTGNDMSTFPAGSMGEAKCQQFGQ